MKQDQIKTVQLMAFTDISNYLRSTKCTIIDGFHDVWVVTPDRLNNKTTRRLNKELGLNIINYNSENMKRFKKNTN